MGERSAGVLVQDAQYDADVETAIESARLWFNSTAASVFGPPKREQLVVFDIDETLLCNIKVRQWSRELTIESLSSLPR